MRAEEGFDWEHPDYVALYRARAKRLQYLREHPERVPALRAHYRQHLTDFIVDWGMTVDPRNASTQAPIVMPFVLFPKQREAIEWILARWRAKEHGVIVKSRDCGMSWIVMAMSVALCLLYSDISIGIGSSKEEKIDRSGDPDCLFFKARKFLEYLPREFAGPEANSAHMRLLFPLTGSTITGEGGDNIGLGGRKTIYFVDEFAVIEHPQLVVQALTSNTNCRIELSSVRGLSNVFAEHALGGVIPRFDFSYLDDPRKVDLGTKALRPTFAKYLDELERTDPVIKASEYDCDFLASIEGQVIEPTWVKSAIGAAEKLAIAVSGVRLAAYDIADAGRDKNAICIRHGIEVLDVVQWSGAGTNANPMRSVRRAFELADQYQVSEGRYDADGMGGSWRSMFDLVNAERKRKIPWVPFRGSGAVMDPERKTPGTDRTNLDYLENYKAQSWMEVRRRFLETHRAVNGEKYDPSLIVSLNPKMALLVTLMSELSQPTRTWSKTGKLMIDKTPDDTASPNLADALMMAFCYARPPLVFSEELLQVI